MFGPVTRCRAEGCEGRGVRHLGAERNRDVATSSPKAKVAIKSTSTVVWTRPYQSENEFLSPKHRSQCTTSMQFVSKKTSRFLTERSICVARMSKAKHHEQGPSEAGRCKDETRANLRQHFTKASPRKPDKKEQGGKHANRNSISLSSSVSKNLQDACSHRADPTYRILLGLHTAHRSQRKALSASLARPRGQRVCGASRRGVPVNCRRVRRL